MVRKMKTAAIAAAMVGAGGAAMAGPCPAEHVLSEPRALEQVSSTNLESAVLGAIDMTGWRGMETFRLRLRRYTIQPGGTVATHSHADRPSIVHIISGEIVEHNSLCAVPITHVAGGTTQEFGPNVVHWWENVSDAPITLIAGDVIWFEDPNPGEM